MVSSVVLCYQPFMDENQHDNYSSHHCCFWGRVLTYVDHILQEKATYWSLSTLPGISFLRRASHPTHTAPPACSFVSCHLAPHEINKIASISRVAGFKSDASWDSPATTWFGQVSPLSLSVFDRWSEFRLLQLALSDTDELPLSFYLGSVSFAKQIHSVVMACLPLFLDRSADEAATSLRLTIMWLWVRSPSHLKSVLAIS